MTTYNCMCDGGEGEHDQIFVRGIQAVTTYTRLLVIAQCDKIHMKVTVLGTEAAVNRPQNVSRYGDLPKCQLCNSL